MSYRIWEEDPDLGNGYGGLGRQKRLLLERFQTKEEAVAHAKKLLQASEAESPGWGCSYYVSGNIKRIR